MLDIKTTKPEKRLISIIRKRSKLIFIVAITIIGLGIRWQMRDVISRDAQLFLLPWYDEISQNGISSQVGNYGIAYQTVIALLTMLPIKPLLAYKLFSICFDLLLAIEAYLLVKELSQNEVLPCLAYAVVFVSPGVFLDSAAWAQCDSIYSFFCLASLRRLYLKKYFLSFLFLGIAFSFKLQAVFIVPFFIYVYILNSGFSAANLIWSLVGFMAPCVPGFITGRSLLDPFAIYLAQSAEYQQMALNIPNIWALAPVDYGLFYRVAIALTVAVLACGLFVIMLNHKKLGEPIIGMEEPLADWRFLAIAAWTVWTCVEFLPAMHERYIYLASILMLSLAFIKRKCVIPWMTIAVTELITYCHYLFQIEISLPLCSVFVFLGYATFTIMVFLKFPKKPDTQSMVSKTAGQSELFL